MAPTFALRGPDQALVLGSPGGDTIPSTITQTFLALALDGMSLSQAVKQPRFHQGFFPQDISVERTYPLSTKQRSALSQRGHKLNPKYSTIGDANIAALIGGIAYAVADAREGGLALAAKEHEATITGSH
jgi:gamma-glutamyltranspeptidase/glutathione hydrolase